MSGTSAEWRESDLVQDLVAKKVLKAYTGTTRAGEEYTRYFETDPDALKAFQERKTAGMNLSQRVWNLSEQYKTELEMAVTAAIEPGTSAMELAADVKKYLNEPDMMFRRFRYKDEEGNWRRKWKQKVTDADGKVHFIDADLKAYHPGRYHIDWKWKGRTNDGHIITFERLADGSGFYYDPQSGKRFDKFPWTAKVAPKFGIKVLRVDNLRLNVDMAKGVVTKTASKPIAGEAAKRGITGRVTPETVQLRQEALQSGTFAFSTSLKQVNSLQTSQLYLGKKPLERIINHCISSDEIDAVRYVWQHPESMHTPRISPLGEGKDMTTERAQKNIMNKRKRGVEEYIEYEFEYAGISWLVKAERHRNGFEQFYHIRKK